VAATLPRAHLLGGSPELTERVIMTVRVEDPNPGAPEFWSDYRWRGPTFALYTGRGWDNPPPREVLRLGPGETWLRSLPADRRPLRQEFRFLAGKPYWLYAAGEPVAADIRSRASLLGREHLVGMTANVRRYTVVSQAPIFQAENLRVAPSEYPPDILPYLELPETVPQRVRDLAARITADATRPYDQALAIEAYLRSAFPYTLDVPLPPPDADVADWFLFELQRGYCDYYATAMVVMMRSLGVPARLAVGYAPGEYDARRNRLIVREKDAHSWPELYFPGYGWIPFEPTPARPRFQPQTALRRPQEVNRLDVQEAMRALRWRGAAQQVARWGGALLVLGLVLGLGRRAWREWRLRRRAEHAWHLAWLRLAQAAPRFGVQPAPWLTPREFAGRWADALTSRYPDHPALPALLADINALAQNLETGPTRPPPAIPMTRPRAGPGATSGRACGACA
jgi:transglutaminase-like putative cysteine protease